MYIGYNPPSWSGGCFNKHNGRATRRRTILQWTNNMGGWSVARSDSPSCLLKQAPACKEWAGVRKVDGTLLGGGGGGRSRVWALGLATRAVRDHLKIEWCKKRRNYLVPPSTPCPPQKIKKHAYLASQTTLYIETWKTDKTFEDLRRKRGSDRIFVHLENIGLIQDGHKMVFGWNGNFEINPMHSLILFRVFEMKFRPFTI